MDSARRAYERLQRACGELQAPFALVDLDAFDTNAGAMERRAGGKPIRLASKSLRCRELQRRTLARAGFSGTLAFTLPEALWLAAAGERDIVVAYPTTDTGALAELARACADEPSGATAGVAVMVDCLEHIEAIERAGMQAGITPGAGGRVRVCIDMDAGWRALGGRVRVGPRRSPLRSPEQAAQLAAAIGARASVRVVGLMVYEGQIAGVGDAPPGRPLRARAIRAMQRSSARELAGRRAAIVAAVGAALADSGGQLEFVNGGGTGSLETTSAEGAVSEVAGGSGLYGPTLFDHYRAFAPAPAAMFTLPVVRRPGPGVVTVLGGGYIASGPADPTRLPSPALPSGLRLDRDEGAGEVQTPLLGAAADSLGVGDRVYFRHAKAGELCERFNELHLIEGDRIVAVAPTYRGEGQCFL
jgi:D-serine deaminase-like pyridoxal phosphate-dependent protein